MNQLTDEQIIELRRGVVSQSGVFGSIEWCCLFARAVIEAEHKLLLADSGEPITVVNGTWGSACVAVIPHDKLYTADHLAAARLQHQQRIAELEAKESSMQQNMENIYARCKELEAQLAERKPLTDEQKKAMWRKTDFRGNGGQFDWYLQGIADCEAAHGIGDKA